MRNVDSKIRSPGFNCCPFLLNSYSRPIFATKSATSGLMRCNKELLYSIIGNTRESEFQIHQACYVLSTRADVSLRMCRNWPSGNEMNSGLAPHLPLSTLDGNAACW